MILKDQIRAFGVRMLRTGPVFSRALNQLEKSQYYEPEALKAYQNLRLQKLVVHCYHHVPYYRHLFQRLGLMPEDIQTVDDLQKLPMMDKETVRENFDQLISTKGPQFFDCFPGYTSGSTGQPAKFLRDFYSINFEYAASWRWYRMHGHAGYQQALFSGRLMFPSVRQEPPFWLYNRPDRMLICSSFHLSKKTISDYVNALRQFKPKIIFGWPSNVYWFAELLEEAGLKLDLDIVSVFVSSETVFDYQREKIQRVLGTRLHDWYGQQERVAAISQCEHDTYHIQEDYSITELVESGYGLEIVGTNFVNYRMPLLRYRTGDYAIPSTQASCPCKRQFRIVKGVVGRAGNQYIVTPDGRKIAAMNAFLLNIPHLRETQLVQEGPDELVINVAAYPGFGDAERNLLLDRARNYISSDMNIRVKELTQIPRSPSGKYQLIVNKLGRN